MMRKLFRIVIISMMVMLLGAMPAMAGNTDYEVKKITNYKGTTNYYVMGNTGNTKATANANWFLKVTSITITGDTSGSYGMAFTPYKQTGNYVFGSANAGVIWAKTSFSSFKYQGWNGNGAAHITYYLGARLDTVLTSSVGTSSGQWNSN